MKEKQVKKTFLPHEISAEQLSVFESLAIENK